MGKIRKVEIDDRMPCNKNHEPLAPRCLTLEELWPAIITKAIIKLFSYKFNLSSKAISVGDIQIIHALTGYYGETIKTHSSSIIDIKDYLSRIEILNVNNNLSPSDNLYKQKERNFILCFNFGKHLQLENQSDLNILENFIHSNHRNLNINNNSVITDFPKEAGNKVIDRKKRGAMTNTVLPNVSANIAKEVKQAIKEAGKKRESGEILLREFNIKRSLNNKAIEESRQKFVRKLLSLDNSDEEKVIERKKSLEEEKYNSSDNNSNLYDSENNLNKITRMSSLEAKNLKKIQQENNKKNNNNNIHNNPDNNLTNNNHQSIRERMDESKEDISQSTESNKNFSSNNTNINSYPWNNSNKLDSCSPAQTFLKKFGTIDTGKLSENHNFVVKRLRQHFQLNPDDFEDTENKLNINTGDDSIQINRERLASRPEVGIFINPDKNLSPNDNENNFEKFNNGLLKKKAIYNFGTLKVSSFDRRTSILAQITNKTKQCKNTKKIYKRDNNIFLGFCYPIVEALDTREFNTKRLKSIDFNDIKNKLNEIKNSYKKFSKEEKKNFSQTINMIGMKCREIRDNRIKELKAKGKNLFLIKLANNCINSPHINIYCDFTEEDIETILRCIINNWDFPPFEYYEKLSHNNKGNENLSHIHPIFRTDNLITIKEILEKESNENSEVNINNNYNNKLLLQQKSINGCDLANDIDNQNNIHQGNMRQGNLKKRREKSNQKLGSLIERNKIKVQGNDDSIKNISDINIQQNWNAIIKECNAYNNINAGAILNINSYNFNRINNTINPNNINIAKNVKDSFETNEQFINLRKQSDANSNNLLDVKRRRSSIYGSNNFKRAISITNIFDDLNSFVSDEFLNEIYDELIFGKRDLYFEEKYAKRSKIKGQWIELEEILKNFDEFILLFKNDNFKIKNNYNLTCSHFQNDTKSSDKDYKVFYIKLKNTEELIKDQNEVTNNPKSTFINKNINNPSKIITNKNLTTVNNNFIPNNSNADVTNNNISLSSNPNNDKDKKMNKKQKLLIEFCPNNGMIEKIKDINYFIVFDIYEISDNFYSNSINSNNNEYLTLAKNLETQFNKKISLENQKILHLVNGNVKCIQENIRLSGFYDIFHKEILEISKEYLLYIKSSFTPFGFNIKIFSESGSIEPMSYDKYLTQFGGMKSLNSSKILIPNLECNSTILLGKFLLKFNNMSSSPVENFGNMKALIKHLKRDSIRIKFVIDFPDIYLRKFIKLYLHKTNNKDKSNEGPNNIDDPIHKKQKYFSKHKVVPINNIVTLNLNDFEIDNEIIVSFLFYF